MENELELRAVLFIRGERVETVLSVVGSNDSLVVTCDLDKDRVSLCGKAVSLGTGELPLCCAVGCEKDGPRARGSTGSNSPLAISPLNFPVCGRCRFEEGSVCQGESGPGGLTEPIPKDTLIES